MTKYEMRMQEAWSQVSSDNKPSVNCKILLDAREGDYLIKSTCKFWCLFGNGYIACDYKPSSGWFGRTTRKRGLRCFKEEGRELLVKLGKNYKMVKKSKNE